MGGALRALSNSTEALFLNPANMAVTRVYHIAGTAQIWPQASRQTYGGAAVDSVVNRQRVSGGLAANWTRQDPDGLGRRAFDFRFALAAPLSDQFLFGAAVRYLSLSESGYPSGADGLRPSVAAAGLNDQDIVADLTFDAGLSVKPAEGLSIALVGQNLTDTGTGFLPMLFGGGVGYGNDDFSIEADVVSDFTTYERTTTRVMAGGELLLGDSFPLRAGYTYDEGPDTQSLSGGLGFLSREFSVDATARTAIAGPRSVAFILGFKYHMDAVGFGM